MSVIDRLKKRRKYPVDLGQGAVVYVRAMLIAEHREVIEFKDEDESFGFAIGCGLLGNGDEPEFCREEAETPIQFGGRVVAELEAAGVPTDTRTQISLAIINLTNGPTNEQLKALVKN